MLYACIAVNIFGGCNTRKQESASINTNRVEAAAAPDAGSILDLDPRLQDADSLVFVFYKDPHGADSLRYTRYYTQFISTDSLLIGTVRLAFTANTERFDRVRPCRSEGKIWCFSKGNIFQTVYFSTSPATCHFVYIIKHGLFYYSPLPEKLEKLLVEAKERSTDVKNDAEGQ